MFDELADPQAQRLDLYRDSGHAPHEKRQVPNILRTVPELLLNAGPVPGVFGAV
jgi:hypothetical protein